MSPSHDVLAAAITEATRAAFLDLRRQHPENFYYFALITTGEALTPFCSAWSHEAVSASGEYKEEGIAWLYAESPYCNFGEQFFTQVRDLFDQLPEIYSLPEQDWESAYQFRLGAMEAAIVRLDAEGLFGRGAEREHIYVNVEVMPSDYTNTERAIRLNPPSALLTQWLNEAAESPE
jgi:hypothetical protein